MSSKRRLNADGQVIGIHGIFYDVTARKAN